MSYIALHADDVESLAGMGLQVVVVIDAKTQKVFAEVHPVQAFTKQYPGAAAIMRRFVSAASDSSNGQARRVMAAISAFNQAPPKGRKKA